MNQNTSNFSLAALLLGALFLQSPAIAQDSEITVTIKGFEDWQVRCEKAKDADKSCVMTQQALVQTSGQRLMQANIAKKDDDTLMTLILPLGIYLPGGAVMQMGEEEKTDLVISLCNQSGCFVNQPLDNKMIRAMGSGETVTINIQDTNGQVVNVPLSTKGFSDAHRSL